MTAASISVITPTVPDRARLLEEALASVHAQRIQPLEHLVGEDVEPRRGPAAIRNGLAEQAKGRWLAFLDDDDVLYPNHLAELWQLAENDWTDWPTPDVCYSSFDVQGRPGWEPHRMNGADPGRLREENWIPVTALVRRDTFLRVGGFPTDPCLEDWGLWLRILNAGGLFASTRAVTWCYRFRDDNRTWGART